jgi:hypothetical protein
MAALRAISAFLTRRDPRWLTLLVAALLGGQLVMAKMDLAEVRKDLGAVTVQLKDERLAHQATQLNYRNAAEQARQADLANKARVEAEQKAITERTSREYEARIADARATAQRLRDNLKAAGNPSGPRAAPLPGTGSPASGADEAPAHPGLSLDERLVATEQAIQLDELISWVERQTKVKP